MRYGHRCETHGEFDSIRQMAAAGESAPCPQCGILCPRYYGYQTPLIIIPGYFHTNHADIIPKPSDFDSRSDYLKATENLGPYRGADEHVLGQDPEQKKEADALLVEQREMLADPAVHAALEQDRQECLTA